MSNTTFDHFGDRARYSDNENDGTLLAADLNNGTRVPASAWRLAKRLHAAGGEGVLAGDVSVTDKGILERAGLPLRTDAIGSRVRLDEEPTAKRFVIHAPQEAPRRQRQHYSGGAPVQYEGPRFSR